MIPHDRAVGPLVASVFAATSACAVSLAYPSADCGWLAWVALVPLCVALEGRGAWAAGGLGALYAAVTAVGIFGWLFEAPGVTPARFAVLALYAAVYPIAWCAGVALLGRRRFPLAWSAAAWWVVLETLRGHAGFLSFSWATLAQTQHRDAPLLQLAAWTGEAGLSFVVVAVNVAIARALPRGGASYGTRRTAFGVIAAALALHVGGAFRLAGVGDGPRIDVAVVQPHIGVSERADDAGRAAVWRRLASATRAAASGADLVVWPETAIGDPQRDPVLAAELLRLSSSLRAALITGAAETEKFTRGDVTAMAVERRPTYNSAVLVEHGALVGAPYRKRILLPFGEYLPLRAAFDWPAWLVPGDLVDGLSGDDVPPFVVDRGGRAWRVATLICWENTFAGLTRRAANDGAVLVVHLVNDAWFGDSRAAEQHDAIAVMRAVESGVPVVVASNDGPSEIIDAYGRVVARLARGAAADVVTAALAIAPAASFYSRHGDVFAALCLGSLFAAIALRFARVALRRAAGDRPARGPVRNLTLEKSS